MLGLSDGSRSKSQLERSFLERCLVMVPIEQRRIGRSAEGIQLDDEDLT